ncbi:MAG: helix-turn-helix domain-containing protein, partial [Candidatus Omnitrophica bacterium]|nr:helix-turn-helix domain-containing protein [Candidatus Omnitrophota bacterium]
DSAEKIGVSRQAICMWEAGKRELRLKIIDKIASVLGMNIEDIVKQLQEGILRKEGGMAKKISTKAKEVTFQIEAPQATKVVLTGDFISWDTNGIAMKKSRNGLWKTKVSLKPGRYEYKFIVDDQWLTDPLNPNTVSNPYGVNSVKEVTA